MVTFANLFTLVRLLLTPFVAAAILQANYGRAIVLFAVAGVTDAIDGFLARRFEGPTRVGAYFDPIADKILLSAIYISLGVVQAIPWWVVGVVFGRDAVILAMAAYGLLYTSVRRFPPTIWGKISTFLQILAALVVMASRAGVAAPVDFVLWVMVAGTAWSGGHYVWRGIRTLSIMPTDRRE